MIFKSIENIVCLSEKRIKCVLVRIGYNDKEDIMGVSEKRL